ncbi:MAG: hypothetical protein NC389_16605 [Acetatifactor muris]|nr:hypothetical protein [Acetatifactor muris]
MMSAQAMGYDSVEDVIQNLKDAGCSQEMIDSFMKCMDKGDYNGQIRLMEGQRECLLDRVHQGEKQIDCLDYLVYQIGRNIKNK